MFGLAGAVLSTGCESSFLLYLQFLKCDPRFSYTYFETLCISAPFFQIIYTMYLI